MLQLDYHLFQIINGLAGSASFLNPLMRFWRKMQNICFILESFCIGLCVRSPTGA